ncbi:hypothetical protein LK09_08150 [Microbacterium mangrovi]|uniref:Uncharacterized protein n=2 Tax=Microbacterium mangrovi TaxID=1348253 RepID=A0A0B2AB48_9MICO|nr:hypothetical protein LK09_08150 [Microbacterium mangrovi]
MSRRGLIWATVGAVVLLIAIVAIIAATLNGAPQARPSSPAPTSSASPSSATQPQAAVVDEGVTQYGWVPEPITTDRETYVRAALAAASTFDPSKSTRDKFLAYLATWFTPDARWKTQADRDRATQLYLGALDESVVLPDDQWTQLRSDQNTVTAKVTGPIKYMAVPNDPGGMSIATADVTVTYRQGNVTNDDQVRVSVQVLCGSGSVPAPGSAQRAGDCKVVRFFDSALEG